MSLYRKLLVYLLAVTFGLSTGVYAALETGTYINSLVATNPTAADPKAQGDDHIRLLKSTILATFPNVTGAVTATHTTLNALTPLTNGTVVASTSGTSIDFTGIPSWVKRITVNFAGVSTNGTDSILIQLGDSGGIETSGYLGTADTGNLSSGFKLKQGSNSTVWHGSLVLTLLDASTNTWVGNGGFGISDAVSFSQIYGSKALSATLDRVRATSVNGVVTFDAGLINIQYE